MGGRTVPGASQRLIIRTRRPGVSGRGRSGVRMLFLVLSSRPSVTLAEALCTYLNLDNVPPCIRYDAATVRDDDDSNNNKNNNDNNYNNNINDNDHVKPNSTW